MKRLLLILVRLISAAGIAEAVRESDLSAQRRSAENTQHRAARATDPALEDRSDWHKPKPEKTPHPTYWPAVVGLGVMFFTWGIIANIFVLVLGALLMVAGFSGWIGDLLGDG